MTEDEDGKVEPSESFYQEYLQLVEDHGGKAVEEAMEALKKTFGAVPLVPRVLAEDKEYFLSTTIKNRSILHRENGPLDMKTLELVVISAATALRCDHCLEVHIRQAQKHGATKEEILQTMMAASAILETSARATAFRKYRQAFGKSDNADQESNSGA